MTTSNKELISKTLARRMISCINEYRLIKEKKSKVFKTVKEFCKYHNFSHQNFMKILHRYEQNPVMESLIPQKRGPKYQTRRIDLAIENLIIGLRKQGNNRYEIKEILKRKNIPVAPSYTTIYNICKKHGLNRLKKEKKNKQKEKQK